MGKAWIQLSFVAVVVASIPLANGNSHCKLKTGMYKERKLLQQRYATLVGKDYQGKKRIADNILKAKKTIDREYYDFLEALANAYARREGGFISSCCTQAKDDPLASQLCAVVWYLYNGRKDPAAFIASLPRNQEQLAAFWSLDDIAYVGGNGKEPALPGIPLPDGLVDKYISELFALLVSDYSEATDRYFILLSHADGEYAEYMDEQLKTLFEEHQDMVLRQWSIIRNHKGGLKGFRENLSSEESRKIAEGFRTFCGRNDQRCEEIFTLFH